MVGPEFCRSMFSSTIGHLRKEKEKMNLFDIIEPMSLPQRLTRFRLVLKNHADYIINQVC